MQEFIYKYPAILPSLENSIDAVSYKSVVSEKVKLIKCLRKKKRENIFLSQRTFIKKHL